ncbi:MAG: oxidoreductase [Betaproteobacteria bacterium RIFCSPLOWO2_02_FULL_63_19]|nr:MAG: oxidoreductase [Betaproteobacteria bacterium RIFCSPLOWO2_02_FULL_63_19]
MKKWNLVIDVAKCFNCNCCTLAVHDEYSGNSFPGYTEEMPRLGHRWFEIRQREQGEFPVVDVAYLPVTCNHCDEPSCMKGAPEGAINKRADGIVIFDPVHSKGHEELVKSCPYGMIWWNEEKQLPQTWPFDAHLLDQGWKETRASQVCPTGAIRTVHAEDEEMQRRAREEDLQVLHPEFGNKPRIYYKNIDRYFKCFVAGTLEGTLEGTVECIQGARVVLFRDTERIAETESDTFGDFRFRGLEAKGTSYRIEISDPRFASNSVPFTLTKSRYLGAIALEPKA